MDMNLKQMKAILDQNSEKIFNVNNTMVEHFEKLIKKDGNEYIVTSIVLSFKLQIKTGK